MDIGNSDWKKYLQELLGCVYDTNMRLFGTNGNLAKSYSAHNWFCVSLQLDWKWRHFYPTTIMLNDDPENK